MVYTYPIGLLVSLPIFNSLGQKIYNFVAGNRLTERCTVENCSLPVYTKSLGETDDVLIKGFNQFKLTQFFWKVVLLFLFFSQLLFIWFSPWIQNNFPKVGYINKVVNIPYENIKEFHVDYLGITHHPVFMFDYHFENYRFIFKIEAVNGDNKKEVVPLLDTNGMVKNSYATGAFWVNHTFRVNGTHFNLEQYQKGILPYLKYFESQSKLKIVRYIFYYKEIKPQEKWEKDFLHKQIAKPWIEVGIARFETDSLHFDWNDKMDEILELERE